MKKVVFLTIGEAPRLDLQETFDRFFAGMDSVAQDGLLNGLEPTEAETKLGWKNESPNPLTSRFVDGGTIVMDAQKVEQALQEKITILEEEGAAIIAILCTGAFHSLQTQTAQLVEPEKITIPFVKASNHAKRFGILVPLAEQLNEAQEKWALGEKGQFAAASPYDFSAEQFKQAAKGLAAADPQVVVLDCMGYTEKMKLLMEDHLPGVDVILSNELLFEYIKQLLEEDLTN